MTFGILFLGFGLGLLFVIPPGPIAVTLVEVGVNQGRSAGARSGMGIAAGDTVSGGLAGVTVASGGMLPTAVFDGVRITSAIVLIGLGAIMIGRPGTVESMAAAITRPARTFFFLTALTPTVFGAWLAILAAMPFAHHLPSSAAFVVGSGGASAMYHVALGSAAGEFGHRLSGVALVRITQLGGAAFAGLGLTMVLG